MDPSLKSFGIEYTFEGKDFGACIVAESMDEARRKLAALSSGAVVGEMLLDPDQDALKTLP